MNYDTIEGGEVPIKAWTHGVPVEESALEQVRQTARLPIVGPHVALMPDVHFGIGATVGSVVPTRGAIVPACVGVDIGCGMTAFRTALTSSALGDNGQKVFDAVSKSIPHGRTDNGGANDRGAWKNPPPDVLDVWAKMSGAFGALDLAHRGREQGAARHVRQLGTLGGGNHFVEVCLDESDRVWVMLHSGSRGIGNTIGSQFIAKAKLRCEREGIKLPNKDLAWLPEGVPEFDAYVAAVGWAQEYALQNRRLMMTNALSALAMVTFPADLYEPFQDVAVECHHNYVSRERHFGEDLFVTRKGAVSARVGELGIIPGAMGRRSFIVRGKGDADSFHSCSHGAGRVMARGQAKREISVEQHVADTAGLFCRKDAEVIDESPRAYKDVDDVIAAQSDLVEVVHTLHAVVCVKG